MRGLLEKLANAHGICGYEGGIAEVFKEELEPYVDKLETDKLGNVIGIKTGEKPSIMLAAHLDEIGLMVRSIDENGYLRFMTIGGIFDQTLLNQRVIVHGENGDLYGIIGSKPIHLMTEEERKKLVKYENMFIDVGATSRDDAKELGVTEGTPVSLDRNFVTLKNDRVTCKAFDNRAGVAILIESLKRANTDNEIYAVGTVQEEVGLKGARTSAFRLNPDVALALEVSIPVDYPEADKKDSLVELGKGPVIGVADASGRGLITPPTILRWLRETAERESIKYQLNAARGGTTDATAISLTREGILAGVIGVPTRYIHTPVEVLSLEDLGNCAELIAKSIRAVDEYFSSTS